MTAFERTARQIAAEERQLRQLAEERLREFARLALDFASVFLAEELDARTRADPSFLSRATAADWRSLLQAARPLQPPPAAAWLAAPPDAGSAPRPESPDGEVGRLGEEVARLQGEVRVLTARLAPDAWRSLTAGAADPSGRTAPAEPAALLIPPAAGHSGGVPPARTAPAEPAEVAAAPGAAVCLPPLPTLAPSRFADQLRNWPRESLALCALGVTGWSMRRAVAELMAALLGDVQPNAGSLRRLFAELARQGFWREEKAVVSGLHPPAAGVADAHRAPVAADATTLILVRLTDLGRDVLRACGIQPVASEWERLFVAHGRAAQPAHAGLVCTFTYQARRRGYATVVCPEVGEPAAPDVQVSRHDERLLVEVEDESGSSERRLSKWRRLAALQGRAAIVTLTPAACASLVNEARAAGVAHGVATDLATLVSTQTRDGPLWTVEW